MGTEKLVAKLGGKVIPGGFGEQSGRSVWSNEVTDQVKQKMQRETARSLEGLML